MWIYILVGLVCNLIGALTMWFMMKPHVEGAIIIENGNAYAPRSGLVQKAHPAELGAYL